MQPEVPHRRRRGAKNNTDIIKTRRGIQSQNQGLNQHNSRKNKLLMVLLLECFFKLEMHRDCSSILGCLAFHAACPELQQLQNKYTKYGPIWFTCWWVCAFIYVLTLSMSAVLWNTCYGNVGYLHRLLLRWTPLEGRYVCTSICWHDQDPCSCWRDQDFFACEMPRAIAPHDFPWLSVTSVGLAREMHDLRQKRMRDFSWHHFWTISVTFRGADLAPQGWRSGLPYEGLGHASPWEVFIPGIRGPTGMNKSYPKECR